MLSGWLKEVAFENIPYISLTLDTFQLLSGWLKEVAFTNIQVISLTLDTLRVQCDEYEWYVS